MEEQQKKPRSPTITFFQKLGFVFAWRMRRWVKGSGTPWNNVNHLDVPIRSLTAEKINTCSCMSACYVCSTRGLNDLLRMRTIVLGARMQDQLQRRAWSSSRKVGNIRHLAYCRLRRRLQSPQQITVDRYVFADYQEDRDDLANEAQWGKRRIPIVYTWIKYDGNRNIVFFEVKVPEVLNMCPSIFKSILPNL